MFYYRSAYPRGLRSSFRKKGSNRRRHCFAHRGGRANTILLLQRSRSKFDRGFVVRNRNITSHSSSFPAWRPSTGRPSRAPLNIGVMQEKIMKRSWSLQALRDHIIYNRGKDQSLLDLVASIDRGIVIFRYHFATARDSLADFFGSSEAAKQEQVKRVLGASDDQDE